MLLFSNLIEKAEGFRVDVLTDGAFGHICQEAASAMKGRCKASVEWSRMGKQDKAEKMLLACRDVFAEIVNVLIYEGSQILDEENLLPGPTESICAFKNEELQQLRDCSMYEMYGGRVKALYNMENQSRQDKWMPLRCAGYDGAAYRAQYNERKAKREIYPVTRMLFALSGDRRYLKYVPFMETGGGKRMCEALDKAERTGIEKGIQQGIQVLVSTCHELGLSFEDTASKVKEKFSLGDAEVQRDMKLYW